MNCGSTDSNFVKAVPVTAFSLGVWQWRRLQWKNNLLSKIEENMKKEAIPFPDE